MSALEGCRILDLGIITAGAATSSLLADLGAEVIKIESPSYRDPFRAWMPDGPAMREGAMSPYFRATNRNKRGLSLDLKQAAGREILLRLANRSQGMVENFRRGVLDRLGLGYEILAAVNPALVLASISSQGENGPDAHHVSYGSTLEAVAGMAWHTGYEGDAPVVSGRDVNYPDQVVAIFAASMIVTALHEARSTGRGAHLDLSQRELTSYLIGESFLAVDDDAPPRTGNASAPYVVQDCFRARDGEWVAISVEPHDRPALQDALRISIDDDAEAIKRTLVGWVGERTASDAVAALSEAGIAVATVLTGDRLMGETEGLWDMAIMPQGADGAWFKGFPVQLENDPLAIKSDAPEIGADTRSILSELAGYSASEIDRFAEDGVVELND